MVCIYCSQSLEVINSRRQRRANQVWRRRRCTECGAIFTSTETIDFTKSLAVNDANGKLKPFIREVLFLSLYRACQHRPEAASDASALTETVLQKLVKNLSNGLLSNRDIAAACRSVLQNFDKAAVVQYEAFHADVLSD